MAKYKNKKRGSNRSAQKKNGRRRSGRRYGELQKFAYRLGQVQRGMENPDSLISESYLNGCQKPEKKPKKTLF